MSKCFIVMSFDTSYDVLLEDVLKAAATTAGFEAHRGDEVLTHTFVLSNIWRSIQESDAIIAVLKWDNANLFYELGLAHAIQKPAIVMANKKELDRMPTNLRNLIMLTYDEQHPFWGEKLKTSIVERAIIYLPNPLCDRLDGGVG
jgi:hypothetical protein